MSSNLYPREDQSLSIKQKPEYKKQHLDYAEAILKRYNSDRTRMTRLYESYNGVKLAGSLAYLERTYGKQNKSKFIAYRLGRSKINLLHGEWLKRPLSATVETINVDAKFAKMAQIDFMNGAMEAKQELNDLKMKAGVDVMEGAPIPQDENDPIWEQMSFKDKEEDIMQIILDEQVKSLDLKKKLGECFKDLLITGMCFCKVEIDEQGETKFHWIDPRDAIYEFIQGDDYLEKSPIKGCRQVLSVHDILMRYQLTQEERDKLNAARTNPQAYVGSNGLSRTYMRMSNGELLCDVIHIEWLSVEPEYYKISPKTGAQMEADPTSTDYTIEMDGESYEQNKDIHDANVKAGKYRVETKYKQVVYEATRIGGCIDVNMRVKPFQKRSVDDPSYILDTSYHGFICGTTDGVKISVQQMIENFDNMYDIVKYQQSKALTRAKGQATFFDVAGLPAGKKVKDILYDIENDGFAVFNSAASGNFSGRNLDLFNAVKEVDMGLSKTFEMLAGMENNIINSLNQITGINENREGQIAASSTATNANSAIQASRTITEPLFAGMNGFVEVVMQSVVDSSAISWAFYKIEKGDQILGTGKHKFLQVTKELGFKGYGVHVQDGGKYMEMKQMMKEAMNISLNAKELRPIDYYKVSMAETMAEAKATLETSWAKMKEVEQQMAEQNNQANAQMQQQQLQQQLEISANQLAAMEKNTQDNIKLTGQVQMLVDDNKAKNSMFENHQKAENDIVLNSQID